MSNFMSNSRKKNRWLRIVGGIAAVLIAVFAIVLILKKGDFGDNDRAVSDGDLAIAFIGDLNISASASGKVVALRETQIPLKQSGRVDEILVEVGDRVEEGQPLLILETEELERRLESARQTVIIQEANLSQLLAPPSDAELTASEAAVISSQNRLEELLEGPSDDELAAAQADLRAAEAELNAAYVRLNGNTTGASSEQLRAAEIELEIAQQNATQAANQHSTILVTEPNRFLSAEQIADMELAARASAVQANAALQVAEDALDDLLHGDSQAISSSQAGVAIASATHDGAQARLDLSLSGPSESDIASAQASLAQAQANLEKTIAGPQQIQIVAAEVALEQARISLQLAEQDLQDATLSAPYSGTISALFVAEGEQSAGIVVEITDTDHLEIMVEVDEMDVGKISVGQPVMVTLESWPGEIIESRVVAISPKAIKDGDALVSYDVYLSLGQSDHPIRVGMTSNADFATDHQKDVLLVPNRAINLDRQSGIYSVELIIEDDSGPVSTQNVEVTVGLRDSRFTEILSGLQEGDEVMVINHLPLTSFGPGEDDGGDGPGFFSGGR
jgi:HlyD family secretion protein